MGWGVSKGCDVYFAHNNCVWLCYRNVGMPLSAEHPAPVKTPTCLAALKAFWKAANAMPAATGLESIWQVAGQVFVVEVVLLFVLVLVLETTTPAPAPAPPPAPPHGVRASACRCSAEPPLHLTSLAWVAMLAPAPTSPLLVAVPLLLPLHVEHTPLGTASLSRPSSLLSLLSLPLSISGCSCLT